MQRLVLKMIASLSGDLKPLALSPTTLLVISRRRKSTHTLFVETRGRSLQWVGQPEMQLGGQRGFDMYISWEASPVSLRNSIQ